MQHQHYRKLDLDLPIQKVVRQKPWIVGGWILLCLFLLLVLFAYINNKPVRKTATHSGAVRAQ